MTVHPITAATLTAVAEAATTGPKAATATTLGMVNPRFIKTVECTVADGIPASVGPRTTETALYRLMGITLMVVGELVDQSTSRRTVVLTRYCGF